MASTAEEQTNVLSNTIVGLVVVLAIVVLLLLVRHRRKKLQE
jgi:cobaltochelatase CobN